MCQYGNEVRVQNRDQRPTVGPKVRWPGRGSEYQQQNLEPRINSELNHELFYKGGDRTQRERIRQESAQMSKTLMA